MSKLIISLAGLVIIAAGGLFFWGEFQEFRQRNIEERTASCGLAMDQYRTASISPQQNSNELSASADAIYSCIDEGLLNRDDLIRRGLQPETFFRHDEPVIEMP